MTSAAQDHIEKMAQCVQSTKLPNIHTITGRMENTQYVTKFVDGEDLDMTFYPYRNDIAQFIKKTKEILITYFIPNESNLIDFVVTEAYQKIFGNAMVKNAKSLSHTNIDMIFSNLRISSEGELYCIDREWIYDFPIPYDYVIWRAVSQLYSKYIIYLRNQISREDYLVAIGLKKENLSVYQQMEMYFSHSIIGKDYREKYRKPAMMYDLQFF